MTDRFFALLRTIFLLGVVLLIVLTLMGVGMVYSAPRMAMDKFGPPSENLSFPQRTLYAARLLLNETKLNRPLEPEGEARSFTVDLGEPANSVASRLEQDHLIADAEAFRSYLVYTGMDTAVQAGRYQLSPAMTAVEIAKKLQDPVPEDVDFHILPGWRVEEIAASLPSSGLSISPDEFLALVNDPPVEIMPQGFPVVDSLEGFMMPGQYTVRRDISAQHLLAAFLRRFDETVTPEMRQGFEANGLTLTEAVTLASIVQREAIVPEEQPVIASVFYNRLVDGMKLDSDPTVQYAVAETTSPPDWWKNPLTIDDLQYDSRYNTYIYPGLPPGPISNPSEGALRAVAQPAQTSFYYFRAQCDGSGRHFFAVTYEEHLQNACP